MDELIELSERPVADELYMIAGWHQWADAGAISSGLPKYLIEQTGARKIGTLKSDQFYLFQIPGTHDFMRPVIKFRDGYRQAVTFHTNEIYYSGDARRGMVIFVGEEPHVGIERYAEAFFNIAKELGVRRVAGLGGVYGAMPYDKDRMVSCVYSLPHMREEMAEYAVRFSDYEGGASLGSYLADQAERMGVEYFTYYGFVPAYDFSHVSEKTQGLRIENDYRAWHEVLRRFNHMFQLGIDLTDIERRSLELTDSVATKLGELGRKLPQFDVQAFVESLDNDFRETPFMPLDVWERGLGDLFDDKE
jgi:proteasome assembly chaperone (PAC2) family protein